MKDSLAALPFQLANQVVAAEGGGEASTPAWLFGVVAFAILVGLLIATMMIKVDR